jgi:ribosomal protein S18 acetylase RimI-like enzyme
MTITFSSSRNLTAEDHDAGAALTEKYFNTSGDTEQLQINSDNKQWFRKNFPESLTVIKEDNKIIGLAFVFLSDDYSMQKFISGEMSENELTEYFKKNYSSQKKDFTNLYLCSVFIIPEYRGRGLGEQVLLAKIEEMSHNVNLRSLFYWAYSDVGEHISKNIAKKTTLLLHRRSE